MEGQEARFEELLGDLDAIVWEYETDAETYSFISANCERMLGHPQERWLEDREFWQSIVHPEDLERVSGFYEAIETNPGHHRVEYRVLSLDGTVMWTRDVVHVIDRGLGMPTLVRGVCVDITDQRRAVDVVVDAEARYRSLVEQLPGIVYVWDLDAGPSGEGLYVSPQIERILGFSSTEWLNQPDMWERRLHPDDAERVTQEFSAQERTGESMNQEYCLIARDGREVWVRDESFVVGWSDDGRPSIWQGVMTDITDARRSEHDRRTLLVQLVRAQEEERHRIGGDLHDEPIQKMTAIGMRLHALRGRVEDPEVARALDELAEKVQETVAGLRGLLFELRPPALEREGLAAALEQYLDASTAISEDIRSELVGALRDEPPIEARTIAYRIAQEALVNAGKHAGATRLRVELESRDGGFLTRVIDDGAGMPPGTASAPGHGGLSTMRERAELAGGWFRVLSAVGEGTTVEFWLPADERELRPNLPPPRNADAAVQR